MRLESIPYAICLTSAAGLGAVALYEIFNANQENAKNLLTLAGGVICSAYVTCPTEDEQRNIRSNSQ